MNRPHCRLCVAIALLAMLPLGLGALHGQESLFGDSSPAPGNRPAVVTVSAQFTSTGGDQGLLYVTAKIAEGWHIYSVTQPKGGPLATKIVMPPGKANEWGLRGRFKPWPKPHISTESAWKDLPIESHEQEVTWVAPLVFQPGVDPKSFAVDGKLTVMACNDQGCLPPKSIPFTAKLGEGPKLPPEGAKAVQPDPPSPAAPAKQPAKKTSASAGSFRRGNSHTTIRGQLEPARAAAGHPVKLSLTAEPDLNYHVYALEGSDNPAANLVYKPTLIRVAAPAGWQVAAPVADREPIEKKLEVADRPIQRYYEEPATWTVELTPPADAKPGTYPIEGVIGYQSCSDQSCDPPLAARFEATVAVGEGGESTSELAFSPAKYRDADTSEPAVGKGTVEEKGAPGSDVAVAPVVSPSEPAASSPIEVQGDAELAQMRLAAALALGFLGGALLNLMPCVLPVIGLKVLSFVEQSGHSRSRIFALNAWYSLGLISVFMVLATLAAFAGLGWGQLFAYSSFKIGMTAIVFAMALSFLGVWEIPIPGFVGGSAANELAAREGAAGAFAKGAITTVLATPCTGPFLTSALVWATTQPPLLVYLVFLSVGLGMASPYLLIGAFPRLIRWLPKPGGWMETFKQAMGFVLLATVVYLLTLLSPPTLVPTVALLFGLWAACWWIGRHQWSTSGSRWIPWTAGVAFAAAVAWFSFGWLEGVTRHRFDQYVDRVAGRQSTQTDGNHLAWQPFSKKYLDDLAQQGKTVMIDFTAPWCATCQVLESTVLNTQPVRDVIKRNNVVTLQAQWDQAYPEYEETDALLSQLNSTQIPVVAIFPAGRPNQPIVLRGPYPRQKYVDALNEAGPSKSTDATATAMNR